MSKNIFSEILFGESNNFDIPNPLDSENDKFYAGLNFSPFILTSDNNLKNEICLNLPPVNMITLPSSDIISIWQNKSPDENENSKSITNNKVLGRKRKDCEEQGKHTKEAQDNIIRKVKVIIKDSLLKHINKKMDKLDDLYVNINGKKYKLNKILDIKQDKIVDINTLSNRKLLTNKVKDIFSEDISGKYKKYPKNYNRIAIDKLYETNNKSITSILDLDFLDCIKFFREDDIINDDNFSCLKGLEKRFKNLPNELKDKNNNQKYINKVIEVIKTFEKIYNVDKRPREREKNRIVFFI